MISVVQIRVSTVFAMMLALNINLSSSYAVEEIDNNKHLRLSTPTFFSSSSDSIEEISIPESPTSPRRYQLISSEGRQSFKWALENQIENKKVKLKYFHAPLPSYMDFGSELSYIHTQGYLGSCTAQTMTLSLEYCFKKLGKTLNLSPLYVYYNERLLNDTIEQDIGASLSDGLQAVCQFGACQESTWTYVDDGIKFKKKPSEEAYMESGQLFQGYNIPFTIKN